MTKKTSLPISSLDLDIKNPRFKPAKNQEEAMHNLLSVERNGEKVFALALDICEAGMIDPGDRLYVIESNESGRFTVLDGNRRLTALRLLSDDIWLNNKNVELDDAIRQRFVRLRDKYPKSWPTETDVVVFPDRTTAKRFIRLRHTGENSGAGRSAWSALQIARFDETGVWRSIERLQADGRLDLAVVNELEQSSFNISSYERVAVTAEFQRRFGYTVTRTSFMTGENYDLALAALAKLASDVASGRVTTRGEFHETETMRPYFDEVERAISPARETPSAASTTPSERETSASTSSPMNEDTLTSGASMAPTGGGTPNSTTLPSAAPAAAPTTTVTATVRKPRTSKYLISKKDLMTVTHRKCRRVVEELKEKVEVQRAPFACALLLRSLQEMTAELYLEAMKLKVTTNKTTNIDQAAFHLLGNAHKTDPANRMALAQSFQVSGQVYDEFCKTAHSTISEISPEHVRAAWSSLGGGIDLLWKRIHAETATS